MFLDRNERLARPLADVLHRRDARRTVPRSRRTPAKTTGIEGTWGDAFGVVKRATEAVEPFGSLISLVIKADIRPGYEVELDANVERVELEISESGE